MQKIFSWICLGFLVLPLGVKADPNVEEMQKKMQELQAQVEQLKSQLLQQTGSTDPNMVPINSNAPVPAPGIAPAPNGLPPGVPNIPLSLEDAQGILKNPFVQKFLKLMGHPDFFPNMNKLKESPNIKNLLYYQLGLIVFMMFFRAWRQSASVTWVGKLWVSLYCMMIFWSCSMYFIPIYLFGEPYRKICDLVWLTITSPS